MSTCLTRIDVKSHITLCMMHHSAFLHQPTATAWGQLAMWSPGTLPLPPHKDRLGLGHCMAY